MNKLMLTSPIPPSVNHYLSYRSVIKNGKALAYSYKTQEAKTYREKFAEYVISEAKKQGWDMVPNKAQHFYIDADFYFPRMDKDPNNYWKIMIDAITDTQLIWVDDNVVCERVNRILYDTENPRIELIVYPVDYIGIFDTKEDFDDFASRCKTCSRASRNCSIMNKAISGRIQKDINNGVCLKYKPQKSKN